MRSSLPTSTTTLRETSQPAALASLLAPFVNQKTALVTTYRRNGTPVGTPVHIAVIGDRAFIRTWDQAWKFKRMRNHPEVTIAPATLRGKPTGATVHARARILSGAESEHAARATVRKYPFLQGFLIPPAHRLRGYDTVHIELTPIAP